MKLSIPPYVKKVMDVLLDQGFEAYVVGGAVRDMLLGRVPDDYDVVTNARPKKSRRLPQQQRSLWSVNWARILVW